MKMSYILMAILSGLMIASVISVSAEKELILTKPSMINLTGMNLSIFDSKYFLSEDGLSDTIAASNINPSQKAFLKNNEADGKPIGQNKKPMVLGNLWKDRIIPLEVVSPNNTFNVTL